MNLKPIRNIIFDFGGVIININNQLTVKAFQNLGWKDLYEANDQSFSKELFCTLEKGNTSPEAFRNNVRQLIGKQIPDNVIDQAWNAMILDIPAERIRYLEELKKSYKLYLLSNTNEIHRMCFHQNFKQDFGYSFYDLFERNFYSHEMGMRKPDPQIFLEALKEANLVPEETLFIDDLAENIEAAKTVGLKVLHIQPGTLLERLPGYLKDHQR
jgi:HAD superfamily hydrolase (TIGR01509 family)